MSTKIFSVARLTIGDEDFTLQDFESIEELYDDEQGEQNRIIQKKLFDNNRFISLYFEEGSVFPRPETVYNKKAHTEEKNPRTNDQILIKSWISLLCLLLKTIKRFQN